MKWTAHKLIYRAMGPVHIGHHDLGYIKLSRPYITGRAMWGAATANLTRAYGKCGEKVATEYARFGELLKDRVIFSYFFPALAGEEPWLPRYTANGLCFESASCPQNTWSERRFQQIFFGSFLQTAVSPQANTAQDETLHESEFIRPRVIFPPTGEKGRVRPVDFVGYVFIGDDAALEGNGAVSWEGGDVAIKPALEEIFVGGDTKYGWGRLRLIQTRKNSDWMHGLPVKRNGSSCTVLVKKNQAIPAHVRAKGTNKLKGDIEPLVGRVWQAPKTGGTKPGPGRHIDGGPLCWMPGSVVAEDTVMTVTEYGLLAEDK